MASKLVSITSAVVFFVGFVVVVVVFWGVGGGDCEEF